MSARLWKSGDGVSEDVGGWRWSQRGHGEQRKEQENMGGIMMEIRGGDASLDLHDTSQYRLIPCGNWEKDSMPKIGVPRFII